MFKTIDKVEGITWYYPKSKPRYVDQTCVYVYLGHKQDGSTWGRVVVKYSADDWLFVKNAIASVNRIKLPLTPKGAEWKRDNGSGSVWEWSDEPLNSDNRFALQELATSDEAIIRFEGSQYHSDHTLTKKEKEGITEAFHALRALELGADH